MPAESLPSAYFNWSSGKDAALALYAMQQQKKVEVRSLLTTINAHHQRVTMHGLRRKLVECQAAAIGLPLTTVELPEQVTMDDYTSAMQGAFKTYKTRGYRHCGYGDIFLDDLRAYRDRQLAPYGITATYPLWKQDTRRLINRFISLGFKAIVVSVQAHKLGKDFCGRMINEAFINDLPADVDPCGENGEFHTFCFDGPLFHHPVEFATGATVHRSYPDNPKGSASGAWFTDLKAVCQ